MKMFFYFSFLLFGSAWGASGERHYLMRSPQALLMGDAFTARADDEYTLFYNPAGLGRTKGVSLTPLNPDLGLTNALTELDRFQNFPTTAAGISDRLMGFPVYLHAAGAPNVKMGGFGLSLFANSSTSLILRNSVHPVLDMNYYYDRGFVMGYAYSWGTAGKKKKKKDAAPTSGVRTSVGASIKQFKRSALVREFNLFGTSMLNTLADSSNNSVAKIKNALGYSEGTGWGADLGLEHSITNGNSELSFGLSAQDIGDIYFKRLQGTGVIPNQEMSLNAGVTWRQDFKIFDYSLSVDAHPLNHYLPLGRRLHVGAEFGIPLVRAYTGWSQGYLSYGLSFDIFIFKMMAGFYNVELGNEFKEEKGSRALLYISLFDFSFDA